MKLPSLRNIERTLRMAPLLRDLLPNHSESESGLLQILKEKDKYIHNKRAEITRLRETILDLEDSLENTEWMLTKKQEELDEERK